MRRIFSVLVVMAVMVATLVAMATPAFAQGKSQCEKGQGDAAVNFFERGDLVQGFKHQAKFEDCIFNFNPGEGHDK